VGGPVRVELCRDYALPREARDHDLPHVLLREGGRVKQTKRSILLELLSFSFFL